MLARATNRIRSRGAAIDIQYIPFFFCTRTILRGFASGSCNRLPSGYIPFEGLNDQPEDDSAITNSTITPAERKAFEGLLSIPRKQRRSTESGSKPENVQPTEARAEDELDRILDSTMTEIKEAHSSRSDIEVPESLDEVTQISQERRAKTLHERHVQKKERESRTIRDGVLSAAIVKDFSTIAQKLDKAATDAEVWEIFQTKLLDRVRALRLDASTPARKRKTTKSPNTSANPEEPTDLQILTVTLPRHLVRVHATLEHNFPGSSLTLAILPTLKSLGPAAFALGATTRLYNAHLTALFNSHPTALGRLTAVLEEMEREVYSFDNATYGLLRRVLRVAAEARWGWRGPAMQVLWGTERMRREIGGVWRWCRVVENQREQEALKLVRDREAETEKAMKEQSLDGKDISTSWHGIAEPMY